jgi:hypothetical protein
VLEHPEIATQGCSCGGSRARDRTAFVGGGSRYRFAGIGSLAVHEDHRSGVQPYLRHSGHPTGHGHGHCTDRESVRVDELYGGDSDLADELKDAQTDGVEVALGTTNDQITAFLTQSNADTYVNTYVKPYGNTVKLMILGNEPFWSKQQTGSLVPALTNLRQAFTDDGLSVLPVTINESFGIVQNSYPPACTTFVPQYAGIASVLAYLQSINSFILVDIYPYQAYRDTGDRSRLRTPSARSRRRLGRPAARQR